MGDCNGNCTSCRASSVRKELTPEAREKLAKQFSFLAERYRRIELMRQRIVARRGRFRNVWDYPYE